MKRVYYLKYINNPQFEYDEKILGFFYAEQLPTMIEFYSRLPGFCENKGDFDYSKSLECSQSNIFLLQIWNKSNDEISIFEDIFNNKSDALSCLNNYIKNTDMKNLETQIEAYSIGDKFWCDGFFSY